MGPSSPAGTTGDSRVPAAQQEDPATRSAGRGSGVAGSERAAATGPSPMTAPRLGSLTWLPAGERSDLLGAPVAAALGGLGGGSVWVAEIDDDLADTAA